MSAMDRLTDEQLDTVANAGVATPWAAEMARELLAHRRASQAASGGCGYPCGYDCNGACFQAAPAPSDELAQIDAMLMEGQGDDDGDQVLPDFEPGWSVAAKVEACLHLLEKRRDLIAATAPSDGLREAAATILAVLEDPDSLAYEHHPDWQAIYTAMTEDHNQSMEICGIHDWPSLLTSAMEIMAEPRAALTPAPAQKGDRLYSVNDGMGANTKEPRHD